MKRITVLAAVAAMSIATFGAAPFSITGTTDKDPVSYRPGEPMTFTLSGITTWESREAFSNAPDCRGTSGSKP